MIPQIRVMQGCHLCTNFITGRWIHTNINFKKFYGALHLEELCVSYIFPFFSFSLFLFTLILFQHFSCSFCPFLYLFILFIFFWIQYLNFFFLALTINQGCSQLLLEKGSNDESGHFAGGTKVHNFVVVVVVVVVVENL